MGETDFDQLIVTLSSTLFVSNECQRRIQTLTERTKNFRLVEHIVGQKRLGILVHLNVNLSESIVSSRFGASSGNTSLKPRLEHTKTITSLGDLHHLIHGAGSSNSHQNTFDEILIGSEVKELSNDLGSFGRRDFGDVDLNVLKKTVQVQILRKLVHEIETVAHVNKRTWVGKLRILKILLHFSRIVNVRIPAHTFSLLELTKHTRRLDVLEMNYRIL
mmetsp:Transcript_15000/g.32475  ORF Transcript_15000/g.32475 Transcript_15000/m.32475 type:complete len:218 (+) Transcript_15000:2456-3109(+)